jgi:hypothetical protein
MTKIDDEELEILSAYEKGRLKSVATKAEIAKLGAAARATGIKIAASISASPQAI